MREGGDGFRKECGEGHNKPRIQTGFWTRSWDRQQWEILIADLARGLREAGQKVLKAKSAGRRRLTPMQPFHHIHARRSPHRKG
jgi:hypothetical protein